MDSTLQLKDKYCQVEEGKHKTQELGCILKIPFKYKYTG